MENQKTEVFCTYTGVNKNIGKDRSCSRLEGQVLDNRFLVIAHLASGGMGDIYLAKHIALNRRVAIKVIKPILSVDEKYLIRFLGEARSVSELQHPNIISVIDFGRTRDGLAFFVMEYLEGEDLARKICRQGAMSWAQTKMILLQILDGLMAAHQSGIVHCDMKPGNCFLTQVSGVEEKTLVKILDFGIAKRFSSEGSDIDCKDSVVGTAAYMAPEQARGEFCDERTDIYSVGCIAFEMLTGRIPYPARSSSDMLIQHITATIPRIGNTNYNDSNRAQIEEVLLRCMAKGSQDRFRNVQELAHAIRSIPDDIYDSRVCRKLLEDYSVPVSSNTELNLQEYRSEPTLDYLEDWMTTTLQSSFKFELH